MDVVAASSPAGGAAVYGVGQADQAGSGGGSRERKDSVDSVIIYNGELQVMKTL